jgi:hypothetical protein
MEDAHGSYIQLHPLPHSLTRLTCLSLDQGISALDPQQLRLLSTLKGLNTPITHNWAGLTTLQRLYLEKGTVQLEGLASCTQLQVLSLRHVWIPGEAALERFVAALSQLPQLTQLVVDDLPCSWPSKLMAGGMLYTLQSAGAPLVTAYMSQAAGTAATASSSLCSLRSLTLTSDAAILLTSQPPLLQLSGLTYLWVCDTGTAAAAVVSSAAQLTGLKHLAVTCGRLCYSNHVLLQLTALTALEELELGKIVRYFALPSRLMYTLPCLILVV